MLLWHVCTMFREELKLLHIFRDELKLLQRCSEMNWNSYRCSEKNRNSYNCSIPRRIETPTMIFRDESKLLNSIPRRIKTPTCCRRSLLQPLLFRDELKLIEKCSEMNWNIRSEMNSKLQQNSIAGRKSRLNIIFIVRFTNLFQCARLRV